MSRMTEVSPFAGVPVAGLVDRRMTLAFFFSSSVGSRVLIVFFLMVIRDRSFPSYMALCSARRAWASAAAFLIFASSFRLARRFLSRLITSARKWSTLSLVC